MWKNKGIVLFLIFAICNFQVTNCSNVQATQFHKNFHCREGTLECLPEQNANEIKVYYKENNQDTDN